MVVFHLQLLLLLLSFSWQAFALCCPDFRITPSPDTSPSPVTTNKPWRLLLV